MILRILLLTLIALIVARAPVAQDGAVERASRPNILFLFADDQRPDALGVAGNPNIRTPHLDALAARGFRFRANHCMGSRHGAVCMPSRAMLMSGRTLFRVNDTIDGAPTMPAVFGAAGYVTFATGKWHNGRPSFKRSFQSGRNLMFGGMSDHHAVPLVDFDATSHEFSATRTDDRHSSELFADAAIGFLRGRTADADTPFFCYVAFTAPHDPRDAPLAYRQRLAKRRPPLPPNFRGQHGWLTDLETLTLRDEMLAAWPREPEVIRDQLGEYYALIEHLDDQIGRVLAALKDAGHADDTIVVYAADHGLALGSHGLLGKQSLYEHSMGCPLMFAGPGIPRGESDALTYLFDVFPTLCEQVGLEVPPGVDGLDLGPVLRGDVADVRTSLVTAYADNQRAIRDDRWKLIRFPKTGKTLLFDLAADPHEIDDLAGKPEHAAEMERLLALLAETQQRLGDDLPLLAEELLPARIDLTGHARKPDQWQPDWIRAKYLAGEPRARVQSVAPRPAKSPQQVRSRNLAKSANSCARIRDGSPRDCEDASTCPATERTSDLATSLLAD